MGGVDGERAALMLGGTLTCFLFFSPSRIMHNKVTVLRVRSGLEISLVSYFNPSRYIFTPHDSFLLFAEKKYYDLHCGLLRVLLQEDCEASVCKGSQLY